MPAHLKRRTFLPVCRRCKWCCHPSSVKDIFKLTDGPVDFYFCDEECAVAWTQHRHKPHLHKLLRLTTHDERVAYLESQGLYQGNLMASVHALISKDH